MKIINFDEKAQLFVSNIKPIHGSDFSLLTLEKPSTEILKKYSLQDITFTYMTTGKTLKALLESDNELLYLDARFGIIPLVDGFFDEVNFQDLLEDLKGNN